MILAIGALGEGASRGRERVLMALGHVVGGAAGGAVAVLMVWLLATPLRTFLPDGLLVAMYLVVVLVALSIDLGHSVRSSRRGRQVQSTWLHRHGRVLGFTLYGAKLGAGLLSYVPFALTYVVFAAAGLLLGLFPTLLCGAAFGAGRSLAVALGSLRADAASRFLFRKRGSRRLFAALSVGGSAALTLNAVLIFT